MKLIIVILIFILILNVKSQVDKCNTPLECYTKAAESLIEARKSYEEGLVKLEELKKKLEEEVASAQKISSEALSKSETALNQSIDAQNKSQDALNRSQDAQNKSQDAQTKSTTALDTAIRVENLPKALYGCQFKTCSGGDWIDCFCDDGRKLIAGGCNAKDKPWNKQSNFPTSYQSWNCGGFGGGKTINIICCYLPFQ